MPQITRESRGSHAPPSSHLPEVGSIVYAVNSTHASCDSQDSGSSVATAGNDHRSSARPTAIPPTIATATPPTTATSNRQRSRFFTRRRQYCGDPSQRSALRLSDKLGDEIWSLRKKDDGMWGKICKSYAHTPGLRWAQSIRDRNESERSWMKAYCERLQTVVDATTQGGKRLGPVDESRAEMLRTAMRSADAFERDVPRNMLPWNASKMNRFAKSVHNRVAEEAMRSIAGPQHDASQICMNKTQAYFQCGADKSVSQMSDLERDIRDAIKADPTRGSRRCGTVTLRASNTHRSLTTRFKGLFRNKSTFSHWDPKSMCLCTPRPPPPLQSDDLSLAGEDYMEEGTRFSDATKRYMTGYRGGSRVQGASGASGFDVSNPSLFMDHGRQGPKRSDRAGRNQRRPEVRSTGDRGVTCGDDVQSREYEATMGQGHSGGEVSEVYIKRRKKKNPRNKPYRRGDSPYPRP